MLSLAACAGYAAPRDEPPPDAQKALLGLRTAIVAAEKKAQAGPAALREGPAYRTNLPLARLKLRKAEAAAKLGARGDVTRAVIGFTGEGLTALAAFDAGKPTYATPGTLTECAYIADVDGTAQPYYLHLPTKYDPKTPLPLIVFLHGYVPSTSILDPWLLPEEICQIAEDNGCALLIPYGRRNTDFEGVGEKDVLDSQAVVQSLYRIDPMRVYLSGVSMGGMGTWHIALRHPGRYAAVAPMCGQTDMAKWWQGVANWPDRDGIPPFRRWMVEWDSPIDLVMNARNTPFFVQHGENDRLIPVEQSRTIVAAAEKLGIAIRIYEFPGASHYIYWDSPCFKNAWSWLKGFKLNPSPRRVDYKTYSLDYGKSFWLTITDFEQWGKPATISCEVNAAGTGLTITSTNVRQVRIDVERAPLKKVEDFDVVFNGKKMVGRATANWDLYVTSPPGPLSGAERGSTAGAFPPVKQAGLCGPAEKTFEAPFLVVQGTGGDDAARTDLAEKVKRFADEWDVFADGNPRVCTDAEVSPQDMQNHNLVLFGTPQTNRLLGRIAERLPIRIGDHKYEVSGKTYEGPDLGLVMCYPNPLAPERYVLIFSGEWYGAKCGSNHKYDLVPDFIVFNTRSFNYDDTNEHEVAGFFGMGWNLDGATTWAR